MSVMIHMQIAKSSDPKKAIAAGFTSQKTDTHFAGVMTECSFFEQTVSIPFETGNNVQATANRTHSPVMIRKRVDPASPALREFMRLTESLSIEFVFYRPAGGETGDFMFYSVALGGAKVASIRTYAPDAFVSKEAEALVPIEEVLFTFDTMSTSSYTEGVKGSISSHDSHSNALSPST